MPHIDYDYYDYIDEQDNKNRRRRRPVVLMRVGFAVFVVSMAILGVFSIVQSCK